MRVAIYLRVSSEDQAEHGYSLAAQRAACLERARALGATEILEFSDEGVSAGVLDRPGLRALRDAVRCRRVDAVVIWDPDRFARNLAHQLLVTEEMEAAGVRIEFVTFARQPGAEGRLFYAVRGAIAEYEREKIRQRTMAGRLQKAREGKLPFGFAPYGYRYDPARAQLVVEPDEAAVVRRIFRALAEHRLGLNGIARALTQEGVPTRKGGPWHRQVVRQIARNPVYRGVYYANRRDMTGAGLNRFRPRGSKVWGRVRDPAEWIPVPVPAIVDEATWRAAQDALATAERRWKARPRASYLLSGLVRCGHCGQTMTGRRQRNWGRPTRVYTCRKATAGARHPGCGRRVPADALEAVVWDHVCTWLHNPSRLAHELVEAAQPVRLRQELEQAERERQRLRVRQQRLLDVLERGLADAVDVQARLARLTQQEKDLEARLQALREALASAPTVDPAAAQAAAAAWLHQARDALALEHRQAVVRQFITLLTVADEVVTIRARVPAAFRPDPTAGTPT